MLASFICAAAIAASPSPTPAAPRPAPHGILVGADLDQHPLLFDPQTKQFYTDARYFLVPAPQPTPPPKR